MKLTTLLTVGFIILTGLASRAGEPQTAAKKPFHERLLQGEDAKRAAELGQQIDRAEQTDQYKQAIEFSQKLLDLRRKIQGADHWETVNELWALDARQKLAALSAEMLVDWRKACQGRLQAEQFGLQSQFAQGQPLQEMYLRSCVQIFGEKHARTATSYNNVAVNLNAQGKYAEAQPFYQKAFDINRQILGEMHPETALSYNNLAYNLNSLAKYAEAQPLYQKALDLRLELFGEKHESIALACNNLAGNLAAQAKYAEAQLLYEKALALRLELLGEKHVDTALSFGNLAGNLNSLGKSVEAQPLYQKSLDLYIELRGQNHPDTARAYNNLAVNLSFQSKYAEASRLFQMSLEIKIKLLGEKHPDTVATRDNLAFILNALGRYADAQPLHQQALDAYIELFGEKHADTVLSYNNLAGNLNKQAKYAEAQPLFQKTLALRIELFGEKHPAVAASYNNVALNLSAQGKYADAQPLLQKALELKIELYGAKHPDTALSYSNLASNLDSQGKHAGAQLLCQKALEIRLELLGEMHSDTAGSYNNLATNLGSQGKYAEAQPLYQKALELHIKLFGEKHPHTALSYNNLAANLDNFGKYDEAEPLIQKALDLRLELFGQKHPDTAHSYHSLAHNLNSQKKYTAAQPVYQMALDLRLALFGEKHPAIAVSYGSLAANLNAQGKYADAQLLYQRALNLNIELLGEQHRDTAASYSGLAGNLHAQRKYAEADSMSAQATARYESARLNVAGRGLDRAAFGAEHSPYRLQATTRAQLQSPVTAWVAAETDLARGLSDEFAFRRGTTLTTAELDRRNSANTRLSQIQPRILQLVSNQSPTESEKDELTVLQTERTLLESDLAELAGSISRREVASLAQVQTAIAADAAMILWLDVSDFGGGIKEHWGCVIRCTGEPVWERLPGTGPGGTWCDDDKALPEQLQTALASRAHSKTEIDALAHRLYSQRLAPLARHLDGIHALSIAGVNEMAGIPIEVLTPDFTISYVPSGTYLARLSQREPASRNGLLALGDPVFTRADSQFKSNESQSKSGSELPPGGLLISMVAPDGAAAKARLRAGDVLVRYGETDLESFELLGAAIQKQANAKPAPEEVSIIVWREGEERPFLRTVPPGRLGVAIDKTPAREAVANRRQTAAMLASLRGGDWKELPGTRFELARLAKLFGDQTTLLLDSNASEQALDDLRQHGRLSQFRYLHLATHGEANNVRAFESVLILAQDAVPELPLPEAGEPFINGQLSASEVLEFWDLNAELVTLSACETALGRKGGGDGLLGFAQAFLSKGSRAVCLSLWKVDDTATALLMTRFYQNLLGKRDGLTQPMGKAQALAEAKGWLRDLSAEEAARLTAAATKGVVRPQRGKEEDLNPVSPSASAKPPATTAAKNAKPFSHPRFWSAFILIGDPN
jgi:tetratricopeptide (TPR) repeat protein